MICHGPVPIRKKRPMGLGTSRGFEPETESVPKLLDVLSEIIQGKTNLMGPSPTTDVHPSGLTTLDSLHSLVTPHSSIGP